MILAVLRRGGRGCWWVRALLATWGETPPAACIGAVQVALPGTQPPMCRPPPALCLHGLGNQTRGRGMRTSFGCQEQQL